MKTKYHPNILVLWEDQKPRVCQYFECSDIQDKQYPNCQDYCKSVLDCPLYRMQIIFEFLNEPRDCEGKE